MATNSWRNRNHFYGKTDFLTMRVSGLILVGSFALLLAASLPARELSEYRIGDTVEADIVTPAPLIVIDAEGSEALKQKEALKVPAIFVYHPETADEVERDFRTAFSTVHSNFFDAMGAVYQKKRLSPQWLNSPRFKTLSATFKRQCPTFPQLANLIELWAVGKSDEAVQNALVARLREAMRQTIRADASPTDIKLGAQLRLVTVTNRDDALTLEIAEQHAARLHRTNLVTLSRVRSEFQQLAPPSERAQAKELASFLKPNCILDVGLTRQSRSRSVDPLYAADRYEAGQLIARRGQKVDTKIMAALEQLNTASGQRSRPEDDSLMKVAGRSRPNPWLWAGLALAVAGLFVGLWQLLNRRKPALPLPARVAGDGAPAGIISCPSCDENIVIPAEVVENLSANAPTWQQRARAAEQRAERAHAAIRAGVLPHFADWLKQKFVRGLVSERSRMLDAQKSAAVELVELERRLDELHTPLQERLRAYEKRIGELEKSLAAKGEENRELLRAKIQLTRQQLENARRRNPLEFN